jgi:hypothetical protein
LRLACPQTLGSRLAVAYRSLDMLRVDMYNRFPYFVSTYQVGFIVFSGEKAGVWWLHILTLVAHKFRLASPQILGFRAAVA